MNRRICRFRPCFQFETVSKLVMLQEMQKPMRSAGNIKDLMVCVMLRIQLNWCGKVQLDGMLKNKRFLASRSSVAHRTRRVTHAGLEAKLSRVNVNGFSIARPALGFVTRVMITTRSDCTTCDLIKPHEHTRELIKICSYFYFI